LLIHPLKNRLLFKNKQHGLCPFFKIINTPIYYGRFSLNFQSFSLNCFVLFRDNIVSISVVIMSIATKFCPASGILISAYRFVGSTNCKCIGLTLLIYLSITEIKFLHLLFIFLNKQLTIRKSASVSTNTLMSIKSTRRGSSRMRIPSNIMTSFGSTGITSSERV